MGLTGILAVWTTAHALPQTGTTRETLGSGFKVSGVMLYAGGLTFLQELCT